MERKEAEKVAWELAGLDEKELKKAIFDYYGKEDLTNKILNIQPLYFDKVKNWWAWNKEIFCWELIDETDIMNLVKKLSTANTIQSKEKNEILEALRQGARLRKPNDIKPTWIQFKNQIIDIETGERFEATPTYFVTNPISWELHNNNYEETPVMDKIFKEWVGEKYVKTLYQILAYCLLPSYPVHRLFCFIGDGLNGKTCFLRLLKKFIGNNNVTSTELDTLLNSRFEITRVYKKLVCVMGETNFNEINKTSIIKKLTGQDLIGFEYKNKTPFEDESYAKILLATNNLPTTTDKTIGFYRRWCIIDFPNKFSEEIDILTTIPDEEYAALALKSLNILKEFLKERKFHNEGSVEERMEKYEAKSDFLQKFLDDFIQDDSEGYITKADFYKKFTDWSIENRHRKMSENSLGKKMKEKGIEAGRKYADWLYDGKGGQLNIYHGVKWKD